MKKSRGMNALLMELVIVLFFFILSFTVLAQVYAYAYRTENNAALQSEALFSARNVMAQLRTEEDPQAFLQAHCDRQTEEGYLFSRDGYQLLISCQKEKMASGSFYRMEISAYNGAESLWMPDGQPVRLSASVYQPEVSEHE